MKDLAEVCPFSRWVSPLFRRPYLLRYRAAIRFFCTPLPAASSALLTVGLPIFQAALRVYHVPQVQLGLVRPALSAGSAACPRQVALHACTHSFALLAQASCCAFGLLD